MQWNDRLNLGVDIIDRQHKELFDMTGSLLAVINADDDRLKLECADAVSFLKDYAVKHFRAEEAYQRVIGYPDFDQHKRQHEVFTETILGHELQMSGSDYAERDVKAFAGFLVTWLLYHVSYCDQKISEYFRGITPKRKTIGAVHSEIVCDSVFDVLQAMIGLDSRDMRQIMAPTAPSDDSVVIEIMLVGDLLGFFAFAYTVEFIDNLVYAMLQRAPKVIGELELSVVTELSNIVSGAICGRIAQEQGIFCDITPPAIITWADIHPKERIAIDTGIGVFEADLSIEYKS